MADTCALSLFKHSGDNGPHAATLHRSELAELLAPEHAEVRGDVHYRCVEELRAIEQAHGAFVVGEPPTPPLRRWYAPIAAAAASVESGGGSLDAQRQAAQLTMERLQGECRKVAKGQLPAWSPARFRDGGRRCNADVVELSCIVLDHDDGTRIEEAVEPWSRNTVLVATSWSHTVALPKFRLVLPLAVPVPGELWRNAWTWAFTHGGKRADKACSDAARMYYLPARPHAWAPYESRRLRLDGPLLQVDIEGLRRQAQARLPPAHAPIRPVTLPREQAVLLAGQRLRHSPDARVRAGQALGGVVLGGGGNQRIDRVGCPRCGRLTVWWWVSPDRQSNASCKHADSCGWSAPLIELLGGTFHV